MTDMNNVTDINAKANIIRGAKDSVGNIGFRNVYEVECLDKEGNLKWIETIYNTVTNVGLDNVIDEYFLGSAYTAAFYVGLIDGTAPSVLAADTMASHAGWTENQNYKDSNNSDNDTTRPVLTLVAASSQSTNNSASKAAYGIDVNSQTIGGIFVTDTITKGGATGLLYGGGSFTGGDKSVDNGDTLNVTVTLTASSV